VLNDYLIFVCIKYSKVKSLVVYSLCWYLYCSFRVDLIGSVLLSFLIFWDIENQDAFFLLFTLSSFHNEPIHAH